MTCSTHRNQIRHLQLSRCGTCCRRLSYNRDQVVGERLLDEIPVHSSLSRRFSTNASLCPPGGKLKNLSSNKATCLGLGCPGSLSREVRANHLQALPSCFIGSNIST